MELTVITLTLLGITVASFLVGSIWLAKFAFRLSAGQGIGVLLFPPYTFYFAFYQLDNDAKDRPTALWMFGLVASILLVLIFTTALRVPSFVDPTPADQGFVTADAGKEVTFTVSVFDLDSQGSVFMKIPTLENYQGAEFKPAASAGSYEFKWKTSFENAGEYQLPIEASDGVNVISRTVRLKINCADDCKADKAAKAAAAAKAAEEAARKAEEERKAAEAAAAAAANCTTGDCPPPPNGTTPNGAAPANNGAAPANNGTAPANGGTTTP